MQQVRPVAGEQAVIVLLCAAIGLYVSADGPLHDGTALMLRLAQPALLPVLRGCAASASVVSCQVGMAGYSAEAMVFCSFFAFLHLLIFTIHPAFEITETSESFLGQFR